MNVSKRAKILVKELKTDGFNEIVFPEIKEELSENWTKDYAIIGNVYYQTAFGYECSDYFDHTKFKEEFEKYVKEEFPGCSVRFMWSSQEIEIDRR